MELAAIVLSLFLLMYFAFRGYSIILFGPIFALVAAAASPFHLMPVYSELFMTKAAEFFKMYFSIILLGAVFAKVMEDAGMAKSIAGAIVGKLGKDQAILATILGCAALTYGGLSVFVVVFVIYPFSAALFRQADIPKRLIPATIWLGVFTFSMIAFPGSPQIQNIIPTTFFGTTTWAAPVTGILSGLVIFGLGYGWLGYRHRTAAARGEGYGNHVLHEPQLKEEHGLPHWSVSLIPLVAVVTVNLYFSNPFQWSWAYSWDANSLIPFQALKLSLLSPGIEKVRALWALNIALVIGIILALWIGHRGLRRHSSIKTVLNAGTASSLMAVLNTASGYGYGSVVANLPGFEVVKAALMQIKIGTGPLISEAITANILVGVTGSASGGMTIALGMLGQEYMAWAQAVNMPPDILHRIICLAAGGLDSLPHNGGLITVMVVCGLTHRQSYGDIFAITVMKTIVAFLFIAFYDLTGWL
jgi:H+/gluconate symporter-like permease